MPSNLSKQTNHHTRYRGASPKYPMLHLAATPLSPPPADIVGRDLKELQKALRNPEKANVVLLAEPGSGKTAYVQGFAYEAENRKHYLVLEVNPEKLMGTKEDKDNALLNGFRELVEEAGRYSKRENVILILFIDEFHKLAMFSPSLMEAMKPMLEQSALHGFRLIASTTFEEYNTWIASRNRALDQRFLRITLSELPKKAVIGILKGRCVSHQVSDLLEPGILETIYRESKRLLLSNSQPRASIDLLTTMIGETVKTEEMRDGRLIRTFYTPQELKLSSDYTICRPLLKRVIQRSFGVDIDNQVAVSDVERALKERLFHQDDAIDTFLRQLEMAACGFSDPTRPKFSFLSTGSTGVGKPLDKKTPVPVCVDGRLSYKKHGDLREGDLVYGADGSPVRVERNIDKGWLPAWEVDADRAGTIVCAPEHLWRVRKRGQEDWQVLSTEDILKAGLKDSSGVYQWELPLSEGIGEQLSQQDVPLSEGDAQLSEGTTAQDVPLSVDPYVIGVLYSRGMLSSRYVYTSNLSEGIQAEVLRRLDPAGEKGMAFRRSGNALSLRTWADPVHTKELFLGYPELCTVSRQRRLPEDYLTASRRQRMELLSGLLDSSLRMRQGRSPFCLHFSSEAVCEHVLRLLRSLGIPAKVYRMRNGSHRLALWPTRKQLEDLLLQHPDREVYLKRAEAEPEPTGLVIRGIKDLGERRHMNCILVDSDTHVYQAGYSHVVTHNTELAKIVSETMNLPLKRFDMSRYSREEDAKAFGDDLFRAVWSNPGAYLLLDEVEKSSRQAMNILLQVLDDARLADTTNPDRIASFSGCIVNLTTNVASEVYQSMGRHKGADDRMDESLIYRALCNSPVFETAVLGRIDAIVPFRPLPEDALIAIGKRTLDDALLIAGTPGRKILVSPDVLPYIVKDRISTDTERGGARDVIRMVKTLAMQPIAHQITTEREEAPFILYVKGRARFLHKEIADPYSAELAVQPCYPVQQVQQVLSVLGRKLGQTLLDGGLFLPVTVSLNEHAQVIGRLAMAGHWRFGTKVSEERIWIVPMD